MGLQAKSLTLLALSLLIILGTAAAFILIQTSRISTGQTQTSAEKLATTIADAATTFGQTGDMDGLGLFLENIEKRGEVGELHLVRSPKTEADFDKREGAEPKTSVESEVLETGKKKMVRNKKAHTKQDQWRHRWHNQVRAWQMVPANKHQVWKKLQHLLKK